MTPPTDEGGCEGKDPTIHLEMLGPLKMRSCAACAAWLDSGFKRTAFAGERELARRHHALIATLSAELERVRGALKELYELEVKGVNPDTISLIWSEPWAHAIEGARRALNPEAREK